MCEVLLKNGVIVDGTGNPWVKGDVVVAKGKIAEVHRKIRCAADRVIDATGLVITPGFIDLHTHSDRTIMTNPKASSSIMAGVTTEAVGNCGSSVYGFARDGREQ